MTEPIQVIRKPAAGGGAGTPATTVTDETFFGIADAVGVGANYAREDHTHGSPDASTIYGTMTYGGGFYGTSLHYPVELGLSFGAALTYVGSWLVEDPNILATSKVICWVDGDEGEMEPMDIYAENIADGSFTLFAVVREGPVDGLYHFAYMHGGAA